MNKTNNTDGSSAQHPEGEPVAGGPQSAFGCTDCGAPYGEDGWCDVVIPNETWNRIAPEGGVLCFRCMTKRLQSHGLTEVPVIVASGPYADENEEWRLIGIRHGYQLAFNDHKDLRHFAKVVHAQLRTMWASPPPRGSNRERLDENAQSLLNAVTTANVQASGYLRDRPASKPQSLTAGTPTPGSTENSRAEEQELPWKE